MYYMHAGNPNTRATVGFSVGVVVGVITVLIITIILVVIVRIVVVKHKRTPTTETLPCK